MDVQNNKTLLIKGCLCMSLILSGCGGQSLSEREIVRGVLFTKQAQSYSVCLVLADQNAEGAQPESNKVSAAQGTTPAQALARARSLAGPEGFVLAAGSLYLIGELRTLLRREKEFADVV